MLYIADEFLRLKRTIHRLDAKLDLWMSGEMNDADYIRSMIEDLIEINRVQDQMLERILYEDGAQLPNPYIRHTRKKKRKKSNLLDA